MVTTSDDVGNVGAFAAMESFRAALGGTGIVLPSRAVDPATQSLSLVDLDLDLDLGLKRGRADVTLRFPHALHQKEPAA